MTAAEKLLLALATKEVGYDLGELHAEHAWLEGDVVHVAHTERREGELVRVQHVVSFDGADIVIAQEPATVCAECQGELYYGHQSPGVEWGEDVRTGRPYAGGCDTCCAALEAERRVA